MDVTYNGTILAINGSRWEVAPEDATAIVQAITKYFGDLQRVKEENLRATGQVWIAHFKVYGSPATETLFSLDEAIEYLVEGANNDQHSFISNGKVVCPDGRVVEGDELYRLIDIYEGAKGD